MTREILSGNLWYLAIFLCLFLFVWWSDRQRLNPVHAFLAGICGLLGAMVMGAWMASGGMPASFSVDPRTWGQILYEGKSMFGALLGTTIGATGYFALRRAPILRYADIAVLAVALSYAVIRVDCFVHGHCFGIPTTLPWGTQFDLGTQAYVFQLQSGLIAPGALHTIPVHPTQLYHALLGIAAFLVLLHMKVDVPGKRFAAALMLYGVGRFVIEFFRGDAVPVFGPLDVNHIAALLMLVAGMWLWRFRVAFTAVAGSKPSV